MSLVTEPTQKRRKDWGVKAVKDARPKAPDNILKFRTTHGSNPANVDLTQFAIGMQSPRVGGNRKWNGSFNGHPILIEELAPFIRINYGNSSVKSVRTLKNSLRIWWRLFRKYHDVAPIVSVADLGDFHGAMQMRDGVSVDNANLFLALANAARGERGLSPLVWVKNPRETSILDVPAEEDIRALYMTLKRRVFATIDRWNAFDALVFDGKDWSECMKSRPQNLKWTLADAIATYGGISRKKKHPCPSRRACASHLGLKTKGSKFFDHYEYIVFGLYPSRSDVQNVLMMILLRTGWNGETAVAIDGQNLESTVRDHPTSKAHHLLYSNKERGNTEQAAHGQKRSDLSPANLVELLVGRTKPLRDFFSKEIALMSKQLVKVGADEDSLARISILRYQLASAWVYIQRDDSEISTLTSQNYAVGPDGKKSAMLCLIQETNSSNNGVVVPESITLSDFRDAFISFTYQYSGYSWLETQLAAGHTSVNSLTTYLRKRRWKTFGEGRVVAFLESFWTEIKTRRIADPAVLRAMADRGEISDEQRVRWINHKDRTRVGMGCKDFTHPPKDISPEHVEGDGCRAQRCTLCRLGVVFDDSVDHLARRLAELAWIKREIPLNSWYSSSFPLEVEATELALKNFAPELVAERQSFWEREIREGRHVPLSMEGEYGPNSKS